MTLKVEVSQFPFTIMILAYLCCIFETNLVTLIEIGGKVPHGEKGYDMLWQIDAENSHKLTSRAMRVK